MAKTLFVAYRDGAAATFTVPDDFNLNNGMRQDGNGDMFIRIDSEQTDAWINGNDVRSAYLTDVSELAGGKIVEESDRKWDPLFVELHEGEDAPPKN